MHSTPLVTGKWNSRRERVPDLDPIPERGCFVNQGSQQVVSVRGGQTLPGDTASTGIGVCLHRGPIAVATPYRLAGSPTDRTSLPSVLFPLPPPPQVPAPGAPSLNKRFLLHDQQRPRIWALGGSTPHRLWFLGPNPQGPQFIALEEQGRPSIRGGCPGFRGTAMSGQAWGQFCSLRNHCYKP